MKISLPTKFEVNYPKDNAKYYNENNKDIMIHTLCEASKGYCMYCGRRLDMDGNTFYNIEHSVEKEGNVNQEQGDEYYILKHCKYNMSIACNGCNQIYKKRMIESIDARELSEYLKCEKSECLEPCENYLKLREEYIRKNYIILQPAGINRNEHLFGINYNLLNHTIEPFVDGDKESDLEFIEEHIARFHLNGERFSESIVNVCELIIVINENAKSANVDQICNIISSIKQENVLGDSFIDYIKQNFKEKNSDALVDFCKLLLLVSIL